MYILNKLKKNLSKIYLRYLLIGIWNTVFGYLVGIFVYKTIIENSNIFLVGIVSNIFSISMSFITYKLIVFRTSGNWLIEYMKCYLVYGVSALISIFLLWALVDKCQYNIWIAQCLVVIITMVISYLGHKKFTFSIGCN